MKIIREINVNIRWRPVWKVERANSSINFYIFGMFVARVHFILGRTGNLGGVLELGWCSQTNDDQITRACIRFEGCGVSGVLFLTVFLSEGTLVCSTPPPEPPPTILSWLASKFFHGSSKRSIPWHPIAILWHASSDTWIFPYSGHLRAAAPIRCCKTPSRLLLVTFPV